MQYSTFLSLLMRYKKAQSDISDLYDIGINILDGKYAISDHLYFMLETIMLETYTKAGWDWITWFMFENEYGQKDWSKYKTYNSKGKLIHDEGELRHAATDESGKPICYSYESLYEFLESEHKNK